MQVARLQDALVHALKGLSAVAVEARAVGLMDAEADRFALHAMFSTLTNVNFDSAYFRKTIEECIRLREALKVKYAAECAKQGKKPADFPATAAWTPSDYTAETLDAAGASVGVIERRALIGDEASSLQELIAYGLKGTMAYAAHALEAGVETEPIYSGIHSTMALLARNETDLGKLVAAAMFVGQTNVSVLKALDEAHNKKFGAPVPTEVNHSPVAGRCILISGHDLVDLEALLKQTEGMGINVYTHGEMLPAHGYPGLKKYKHLVRKRTLMCFARLVSAYSVQHHSIFCRRATTVKHGSFSVWSTVLSPDQLCRAPIV
jgi:hydroxylamine reductase